LNDTRVIFKEDKKAKKDLKYIEKKKKLKIKRCEKAQFTEVVSYMVKSKKLKKFI